MVQGMFCGLVLNFVCYGVFALNTGQHERSLYCIAMVYFWCLFGSHNSCEVLFISALEKNVCCGDQNCIAKSKIKKNNQNVINICIRPKSDYCLPGADFKLPRKLFPLFVERKGNINAL